MKITYNADKGFYSGVPARDLTEAEWAAIDKELQKTLLDLGLYEVKQAKKEEIKKESE